jgi:transcription termination factor NusB
MMCNAKGRKDGSEKADIHIALSTALCNFILCEGTPRDEDTYNVMECRMKVHDYLADILTDRMDEVIGYPYDKQMYWEDFYYYAQKFFTVIIDHISEINDLIKKTLENVIKSRKIENQWG